MDDMNRALVRRKEKPNVLNRTQPSVRIFHELLENDHGEAYSDYGGLGASTGDTNVNDLEEKLKGKREERCHKETEKTYLKKKEDVPIGHLTLLQKIKFAEKLQESNKELEVKLDTEAEEIYFEGPQQQFMEATKKFQDQMSGMVEKKLSLSDSILEVLSLDKGLNTVKCELEKNNVEAVLVIDSEARIVGTSAAHADKAGIIVSKLTLEEKVPVNEENQHLLKTSEWRQLYEQLNAEAAVRMYRNNWSDTYVAGLREDVNDAMKTLTAYLDSHCIQEDQFKCSSKIVRRYLSELRQDDLRFIEAHLANFKVKIQTGKGDDDFVISGNKEGLKRAKTKLNALADSTLSDSFDVKQPGLRKYFASGQGDRLVKSAEKDHACAILALKQDGVCTRAAEAAIKSDFSRSDDTVGGTDPSALVTRSGQKISWKLGNIETEQAHILVSSQGACSQAIINAGGPAIVGPINSGDITVTSGFALACSHVIHTNCSQWNGGKGEQVLRAIVHKCLQKNEELGGKSIAFPVIGAGNLKFPPDAASRIMLEEAITFCQAYPSSMVKDIRFVVFQQDQALITAFAQEMANMQFKNKVLPVHAMIGSLPRVFKGGVALPRFGKERHLSIEVINGDLTQEKTDAIMNIISTEMNMNNAGKLSKAILRAGGPQIQQELIQQGNQTVGTAVMTGGGSLAVRHVIHIIPGFADEQHLQTCLEVGLRLADKHNLHSISIPSVGTGGYGLAAADSAQVTFQALNSFSVSCKNVRKVRVVVFQAQMMQDFLKEQAVQDVNKQENDFSYDQTVKIYVTGKNKASVGKAMDALKKGFSEACTTQKVENETVSKLSCRQIDTLRRNAKDRDVRLEIEADVDRIVVRGEPTAVTGMVGEIWNEINERNKKIQENEQAMVVSKNIEWSYEIHGQKMVFDQKTNAKIEMAHIKEQSAIRVSLRGDEFVIDLKAKTGRGQWNGAKITLSRKLKGAEQGIPLPNHWAPIPPSEKTVYTVQLLPSSSEYQDVLRKMQATVGAVHVQKIERVQNPHLYQSYMVRKQKIDKDNGGNSERQLFHGTDGKNISHINAQGFNRSFCGAHGTAYGRGVYFARDASYSVGYAGGGGGARYMYLARVLIGTYCAGNTDMIVPPPKDPFRPEILHDSVVDQMGNPSIFVVFFDNQCYPEYLITF